MRIKLLLIAVLAMVVCLFGSEAAVAERKVVYMPNPSVEKALGLTLIELRAKSTSSAVRTIDDERVEVFLYSDNERVETVQKPSCGVAIGDKKRQGRYMLVSVKRGFVTSKIVLGEDYFFIEGLLTRRVNEGLRSLPGGGDNLFAIYQHLGCTIKSLEFFSLEADGTLKRVPFRDQDGLDFTKVFTGFGGDVGRSGKAFVFCSPYAAIKHTICLSYNYTGKEFAQARSWMAPLTRRKGNKDPAPAYTTRSGARYALFSYLMAFSKGEYKRAAHYFGGSYSLLRRMNPNLKTSSYKPEGYEYLDRYCRVNAGKCYIPTSIKDSVFVVGGKGESERLIATLGKIDSSDGTIKFNVEFVSPGYKRLEINGRTSFVFKVLQTSKGFRVLTLPPRQKR